MIFFSMFFVGNNKIEVFIKTFPQLELEWNYE